MHVRFVNSLIKNVILEGFRWTTNLFKRDSKVKHVEIGSFLDFFFEFAKFVCNFHETK